MTPPQESHRVVPEQYLGYSLQTTRFLVNLLKAEPGSTISLEVFEDVGVESSSGTRIAEQDKSVLPGSNNPVADRSRDLWKTLANWIKAVECNQLQLGKARFEIHLSSFREGEIVQKFSRAQSLEDASRALLDAREALWGPEPSFPLRTKVSASISPYVNKVFRSDTQVVSEIIRSFTLSCASGSPQTDLKTLISTKFIAPEIIDEVLLHALGWVKQQTDLLLEQGKPACISIDEFSLEMTSFVRKADCRTILTSFAPTPKKEEIDRQLVQTYVRQLELIDFDDAQKTRAVNDFLRAAIDRIQWAVKGYVHSSSFDEFEDSLIRTWENLKVQTFIGMSSLPDLEKGKMLCSKCLSHTTHIQGLPLPGHFVPGSFHTIANSAQIGWHPRYKVLLETSNGE